MPHRLASTSLVNLTTGGILAVGQGCDLYLLKFYNPAAAVTYLQVFDATASGGITLGTTVPKLVWGVASATNDEIATDSGLGFEVGVYIIPTTTPTGATGVLIHGFLFFG